MAGFKFQAPHGVIDINTPDDVISTLLAFPEAATASDFLEHGKRMDGETFGEVARLVALALDKLARQILAAPPTELARLTLGQVVYTVLMSSPDGVTLGQIAAQVQTRLPGVLEGQIGAVLARIVSQGWARVDGALYVAPGARPAVWDAL